MLSRSSEVETPIHPDYLSEIMQDLHLSEVTSGYGELAHPWGILYPPQDVARFHFVISGQCWIGESDGKWISLSPGDAVLLPLGSAYTLCSARNGVAKPYDENQYEHVGRNTYRMRDSGDGDIAELFCCRVIFKDPGLRPLLQLMPSVLLLRGAMERDPVLPVLLDTMAAEFTSGRMGSATVLSRLADVVITRIVRAWVEDHKDDTTGWLAAIRDPKLGRAVAAIHRDPGRDWSIEVLADVACVSRSVFSERFAKLVGVPPARYVTQIRMHLARGWLRADRETVAQISERLGYESEAAFSRAFKRHIGVAPSEARKSHLADAGEWGGGSGE